MGICFDDHDVYVENKWRWLIHGRGGRQSEVVGNMVQFQVKFNRISDESSNEILKKKRIEDKILKASIVVFTPDESNSQR